MRDVLTLSRFAARSDIAFLTLRLLVGAFLVWGVYDNISSAERMDEFVQFLDANGSPLPGLAAQLSVYAQFGAGIVLILGLFTRWAGLLMAINFVIGILLVHLGDDFRGQFPALILVAVSLVFATYGPGRFSLDALLWRAPSKS